MRSQQCSGWRRCAHGCKGVKVNRSVLELYRLQGRPQIFFGLATFMPGFMELWARASSTPFQKKM